MVQRSRMLARAGSSSEVLREEPIGMRYSGPNELWAIRGGFVAGVIKFKLWGRMSPGSRCSSCSS